MILYNNLKNKYTRFICTERATGRNWIAILCNSELLNRCYGWGNHLRVPEWESPPADKASSPASIQVKSCTYIYRNLSGFNGSGETRWQILVIIYVKTRMLPWVSSEIAIKLTTKYYPTNSNID